MQTPRRGWGRRREPCQAPWALLGLRPAWKGGAFVIIIILDRIIKKRILTGIAVGLGYFIYSVAVHDRLYTICAREMHRSLQKAV